MAEAKIYISQQANENDLCFVSARIQLHGSTKTLL